MHVSGARALRAVSLAFSPSMYPYDIPIVYEVSFILPKKFSFLFYK